MNYCTVGVNEQFHIPLTFEMEQTVKKSPPKMDIYSVISPFSTLLKFFGLMPFSWDRANRSTKITNFDKVLTAICSACDILVVYFLLGSRDTFAQYGTSLSAYAWLISLILSVLNGEIHMFYLIFKRNKIGEIITILMDFDEKVNCDSNIFQNFNLGIFSYLKSTGQSTTAATERQPLKSLGFSSVSAAHFALPSHVPLTHNFQKDLM